MKKITLLLSFLMVQTVLFAQCPGTLPPGYVCIPDAAFDDAIQAAFAYDDGQENAIPIAMAESATGFLNFSASGITDFTGIDAFVNVTQLNLSNNALTTELDLSANTALTDLEVRNSGLTTIDLSSNTALLNVDVSYNSGLTFIDMRNGNNATTAFNSESTPGPCIMVDDDTEANLSTWVVDMGSGFYEVDGDCPTLSVGQSEATAFTMYPNPVKSTLYVMSSKQTASVEIYSVTGKLILKKNLSFGQNAINVSALKSGMYLTKFTSNDKATLTKKLVIK